MQAGWTWSAWQATTGPRRCAITRVGSPAGEDALMARRPGGAGDPDPQRHRPDSEPQRWAQVYRPAVNPGVSASSADGTALISVFGRRTALVSVFGGSQALAGA